MESRTASEPKITISFLERAIRNLFYFKYTESPKRLSSRYILGCLTTLWIAVTFTGRLVSNIILLIFLDFSNLPSLCFEAFKARQVIRFDQLPLYKYERLSGFRKIRLLVLYPGGKKDDISCEMINVSLDNPGDYEAISYAWGDASELHQIRCGKGVISITHNLYLAMQHFRHISKRKILWADALCIDQSNFSERESQVQIMADVYSGACRTLIWLGEETIKVKGWEKALYVYRSHFPDESFREGLKSFIPDRATFYKRHLQRLLLGRDNAFTSVYCLPICNLVKRSWFIRKWVIQEVVKSRDPILTCGHHSVPWSVLEDIVSYTHRYSITIFSDGDDDIILTAGFNVLAIATLRRGINHSKQGLSDILQLCTAFKCSDHRDHVFSLLGVAADFNSENPYLKPQYSATIRPVEVFRRFALWSVLENGSLDFLSAGRGPLLHPSWVPNFATDILSTSTPRSWMDFRATLDSNPVVTVSVDGQRLCVAGKIIDRIAILGSPMPLPPKIDAFRHLPAWKREREWTRACMKILNEYFTECLTLLGLKYEQIILEQQLNIRRPTPHYDKYRTFIRTLIWHQPYECQTLEQSIPQIEAFLHGILTLQIPDLSSLEVMAESTSAAYMMATNYSDGRRLLVTEGRRMGYAPAIAECGDVVCLLYGGSLPYVVRQCGDGEHVFLGDCYVDGVMYGNGMRDEIDDVTFTFI